jgi:hypothetical protein
MLFAKWPGEHSTHLISKFLAYPTGQEFFAGGMKLFAGAAALKTAKTA